MGIINYGSQNVSFDYGELGKSEIFNKINYKLVEKGIYEGGLLTRVDDTHIDLSTLLCYVEDNTAEIGVRVSTTEVLNIEVSSAVPYIILRYVWINTENNYADIIPSTYANILEDDLIIGRCVFTGSVLSSDFDYSRRSIVFSSASANIDTEFIVTANEPYDSQVNVSGGSFENGIRTIEVSPGNSTVISDTTLGRIDLIYIDDSGSIQVEEGVDSSSPTTPDYKKRKIIAEISRGASSTYITGENITLISSYSTEMLGTEVTNIDAGAGAVTFTPRTIDADTPISSALQQITNDIRTGTGIQDDAIIERHIQDNVIAPSKVDYVNANQIQLEDQIDLMIANRIEYNILELNNKIKSLSAHLAMSNWTILSPYTNGYLYGVCFSESLGLFVAVGYGASNNIQYSSNGIDWTGVTEPNGNLRDVCFSESLGMFVAVGSASSNNIQYSYNGTTWNQLTEDPSFFQGIVFSESLGMFVAVGAATTNNIQYSYDGLDWNEIDVPNGELQAVAFSESLGIFVAVGTGSANNSQYSYDGLDWNEQTVDDGDLRDVCFSESLGMFVAVGSGSANNVQYSYNGTNWTAITVPNGDLYGVIFSESLGMFVAVGTATTNNIQYSYNGIDWTQITVTDGDLKGVCFSESLGMFVAVGSASSNNIQYTLPEVFKKDKVLSVRKWKQLTVADGDFKGVCFSESLGMFVAVGYNSTNFIQSSSDGLNWVNSTAGAGVGNLFNVCFSESLCMFVAVGYGATNNIQYSSDGTNWAPLNAAEGSLTGVCFSESLGMFVAVGSETTNNIQYSYNGTTWTAISPYSNGNLNEVCFSESLGMFVAVGSGSLNNIQYSYNGINWTGIRVALGNLNGVTFSESLGMFVAVGYSATNNIQYSYNGIDWTSMTVNSTGSFKRVCFSESLGIFVAVGTYDSKQIMYSDNGINWTTITVPHGGLGDVCFSESLGMFVAVGTGSTNNIQIGYPT